MSSNCQPTRSWSRRCALRFNDVPSVGVSGKHYTSFCMVGQTAIANKEGYWKDRCIDLDFELLTKEFGIPEQEISFIESVWTGAPGAFGYCLEYFVRGLELGNAVFTAFEGDVSNYKEMKEPGHRHGRRPGEA